MKYRFYLTVVVLLLPLVPVYADGGLSIATSPLPIDLTAKPGTTTTANLRVKNNGTSPERLKASLMKFTASGNDTGQPFLQPRGPHDDYFDWVSFSPSIFDAPPGQWINVTMTIKIPPTAAFGYYLAAVFSRASSPQPKAGETAVSGSTATLVLLDVASSNAKRQLQPISFTADHAFYEFLPASFTVKLRNSGNIHVVPHGDIFINQGKSTVGSIQINQANGNILPNSSRIFTAQWSDGFPVYTAKHQLKWDLTQASKLRFGHYTASFTVVYNDGTRDVPLTGQVTFWVIPWRLIAAVILIPVVPALLVYWLMKRRMKKLMRKN